VKESKESIELIKTFHQLNESDNTVAHFLPSLIGMFGSIRLFDFFLSELADAFEKGNLSEAQKTRATNLADTFIPQIAEYNSIDNLAAVTVTSVDLSRIRSSSAEERENGALLILAALTLIMKEVGKL